MTGKLNNGQNTIVINLRKYAHAHAVSTQAVSHGHPDSRVKTNLTVYDN